MHDHDFEKQVHQKMEELQLSPSDAVWEGVEGQLHKKKRRRILFWIPLLLLSLAAGGYYLTQHNWHPSLTVLSSNNHISSSETTKKTPEKATTASKSPAINIPAIRSLPPTAVASSQVKNRKESRPVNTLHPLSGIFSDNVLLSKRKTLQADQNEREPYEQKKTRLINETNQEAVIISTVQEPARQTDSGIWSDPLAAKLSFVSSTRAPFQTAIPALSGKDAAVPAIRLSAKKGLHWGMYAEVMRTSLDDGNGSLNKLFGRTGAADFLAANPINSSNPGGSGVIFTPSSVRAGAGFSAGFFVSKKLNRRLSISTGVDYALSTTSITIGGITSSSTAQFNSSGINQYFRSDNSNNGRSYTNKYHFIRVPILLQFQLHQGRLPIVWEGGGSLARLLTSNALHYSNVLNGYYKNNGLLNRTQFNVFTGVYLEAFSQSSHPVSIGPQIQTSLSSLSASNAGKHSYFTQVGIKVSTTIK